MHNEDGLSRKNTILLFEEDGEIVQKVCSEAQAREHFENIKGTLQVASMHTAETGDAEMLLCVSPDLRDRLHEQKLRLKRQASLRDVLIRHGVPADKGLLASIAKAVDEWMPVTGLKLVGP